MEASGVLLAVACCAAMVTGLCLVHEAQSFARAQRRAQSMAQQAGASDSGMTRLARRGIPQFRRFALLLLRSDRVSSYAGELSAAFGSLGWETKNVAALTLVIGGASAVGVAVALVSSSAAGGAAAAACVVLCIGLWSAQRCERERSRLREDIPEAIQSMKACFHVGYSLPQTLKEASRSTTGPLGAVFEEAQGVVEVGGSIDDALRVIKEKGAEPELVFLSAALEIQHRTGSSMEQVLEATRQSVADEVSLKRTLRTQTAQAKLSAQVVTVMPFALIGAFSLVSPGFLSPFFESGLGIAVLVIALGMQMLGIVLVRRHLRVEVA